MKTILTACALAAGAFFVAPTSADAAPHCDTRPSVQRVLVGYDRCGAPIYRYVTTPYYGDRHHHHDRRYDRHDHHYDRHDRHRDHHDYHYDRRKAGAYLGGERGGIYLKF